VIERDGRYIVKISQTAYIKDLLKKFNMEGSNTKHVPIRPETLLMHADMYDQFQEVGTNKVTNPLWSKENVDCHYPVRECIGGLLHVTRWSVPQIMFAVNHCAQFQSKSKERIWPVCLDILAHLKTELDYYGDISMEFGNSEIPLLAIYDASHLNTIRSHKDNDGNVTYHKRDLRAQQGMYMSFFGGPGYYNSTVAKMITMSSMESELDCLSKFIKEVVWMKNLIAEFGVSPNNLEKEDDDPLIVYGDNQAAILNAESPRITVRNKHFANRYFFIREVCRENGIKNMHIPTNMNVADGLTKPLLKTAYRKFAEEIRGIKSNINQYIRDKHVGNVLIAKKVLQE